MAITINDKLLERKLTTLGRRQMPLLKKNAMARVILVRSLGKFLGGPINEWKKNSITVGRQVGARGSTPKSRAA